MPPAPSAGPAVEYTAQVPAGSKTVYLDLIYDSDAGPTVLYTGFVILSGMDGYGLLQVKGKLSVRDHDTVSTGCRMRSTVRVFHERPRETRWHSQ